MTARTTIAALSSGRLPSAIAVIRLSGPAAFAAVDSLCPGQSRPAPRRAALRRLSRPADGALLDEALVLLFPAPGSATGEDLAELHCHGSPAVVSAVLDALGALGVRQAEPGEFTRRAFEAGRLDLTQVEGLADLLAATNEAQRAQAAAQANGALRRTAEDWRTRLVALLAEVEAGLDFSDEEDALAATLDRAALARLETELDRAVAGFGVGERVREGLSIAIVGPPNAGKSSLLNALAQRDAAIVSPVAGTTRDVVEVQATIAGMPVTLADTAGLRDSADPVEAEGIARARARAEAADIVIELAPAPSPHWTLAPRASGAPLRVLSKADLAERGTPSLGDLAVSTRTGAGLDELRSALGRIARALVGGGEPHLVTRGRQRDAIADARDSVRSAVASSDPVLVAEHLRGALHSLALLAGRADVESVLDRIFTRFCIGK